MNKKIIMILLIVSILINSTISSVHAIEIEKANLKYDHAINTHIMYKPKETWTKIKGGYICYVEDGKKYPAYCISHGINGVDEEGAYTVTIKELLKDKLIYNTIINGYPYKTPEQLGVSCADDAYIATKQAIYSVLLGRDVRSFYKAQDAQGEKIIDAIYNISENGKVSNNINQEADLKIEKIGEIKETEEYYYQEYSVSANVNILEYSIESIENFSKETYVADKNGTKKNTFNSNENFKIMMPKENFYKDISGKINIKAECKTNSVFFGEAPKNNVQNYAITYKPYITYDATTLLNINTNNARIEILKEDKESLKPISGVTFGLYNNENELLETKKSDEEGKTVFENLYQGKYYIKEIETIDEYLKSEELYEINLKYNETYIQKILNKHKKGSLKVIKIDKDNNNNTLGGIEFDLIDLDGTVIEHLTTDADGECYIENIDTGNYILKETKTKKEYRLAKDKSIRIDWNETLKIEVENEKKKEI